MRALSLVPSATETLLALGVRPVACTRFCEQPGITTVGGTKNPEIPSIVELAPDLVVMNDEENRREDFVALTEAGLRVHSMSPHALADVGPAVRELAAIVDTDVPVPFGPAEWSDWLRAHAQPASVSRRCVTFVWRRPWMALGHDTYGSSVLDALGHENAVAAGVRYPELTLAEVAACGAQVVLLPSEPYAFAPRHVAEVREALPAVDVRLVDGQDLFWWGTRTPGAIERLRTVLR